MGRPAWATSDRRSTLPANWEQLRTAAGVRNPAHLCWKCGLPGAEALDHKNGDPLDHRLENLDWIHDWRSVKAGRVERNCHAQKTRDQQLSEHRTEQHPALAAFANRGGTTRADTEFRPAWAGKPAAGRPGPAGDADPGAARR